MEFAVLGSGSKGNCSLVRTANTLLMIDCGFSVRDTEKRLQQLGEQAASIDAILVTHEHSDHIAGVAKLANKHRLPVYCTHGTAQYFQRSAKVAIDTPYSELQLEHTVTIGDIDITPVPVPHDAKEPCQFIFSAAQRSLGMLSDLGHISALVAERYRHCECLYIEFNHCRDLLQTGPYPPMLKRRVGGQWGHLSNCQASAFVQTLREAPLHTLIVGHISEKNNSTAAVEQVLAELDFINTVAISPQHAVQPWLQVAG